MKIIEKLRKSFTSGLIISIPLIITLIIIKFLIDWSLIFIDPIVKSTRLTAYTANIEIIAQLIAGLLVLIVITLVGYLSNYTISNELRRHSAKIINDIPLFGTVYSTVQKISSSFTGENNNFKKLVLIEYPRNGVYSLGLVTSDSPDSIEDAANEDMVNVLVPMSPNPTMGNLVMVSESELLDLDMNIKQGMKLLLTTGIAFKEEELPEELKNN